jgi:hypothetical protein
MKQCRDRVHRRNILRSHYSTTNPPAKNKEKTIIFMCDGKIPQGGLSDRQQGLVSIYNSCYAKKSEYCSCGAK